MSRLTFRLLGGVLLVASVGCSGEDRPPPSGGGTFTADDVVGQHPDNVFSTGACEEGAVKQCRVYLPRHNNIQPCFVGEQLCSAGAWGDCGDTVLVDASELDDVEDDPAGAGGGPSRP